MSVRHFQFLLTVALEFLLGSDLFTTCFDWKASLLEHSVLHIFCSGPFLRVSIRNL
jgi:hypothetical protein